MGEGSFLLVISERNREELMPMLPIPEGWSIQFVRSFAEGRDVLEKAMPDLVISDIPVFSLTAEDADVMHLYQKTAFVPVLREKDPNQILQCFRSGTYDVLIDPIDPRAVKSMFARHETYSSLLRENELYRDKLEKVNRDLKDSLRILEQDQKAGKQVQQNMLPESPARRGEYEVAFSMTPSLYLSGDFVGYNFVFDRFLLFYLADVSGHGASSAFITVLLRFLLNKIIRRHILSHEVELLTHAPEGFMEHFNRQLISMNVDKHMTVFAGAIDMERNLLRYSVAAHMPPPMFYAGNDARFVQGKGKPLGLFPDATWDVEEIALPAKFIMTMTSDGVLDFVEGDSLQDKMNNMLKAVSESDGTLENICQNMNVDDVVDVPDDITVMTIRRGY